MPGGDAGTCLLWVSSLGSGHQKQEVLPVVNVAIQDLTEKRKDFPGPENMLAETNQRKTNHEQVTCP